jgi:tetratricopeptide (TPR) repeat protein
MAVLLGLRAVPIPAQSGSAADEACRRGTELLIRRSYRQAAVAFEAAVTADSTCGPAWAGLGQACRVLGDHGRAVTALAAAARLGALSDTAVVLADSRYLYGVALLQERQPREAIAQFQALLARRPEDVRALTALGLAFLGSGDEVAAARAYERAATADSAAAGPRLALGELQARQGDVKSAMGSLRAAIRCDSMAVPAYTALARLCLEAGDPATADTLLTRACAIDSTWAPAWVAWGAALNRQGRQVPALVALRRAVQLAPRDGEARFRLAEAFYGSGEFRAAVEAGQTALRLRPGHHATESLLGDACAKLGQRREAIAYYTSAAQDPFLSEYCRGRVTALSREARGNR